MKNLKKILSLTLALAMALSLMTTALAKDTGDFADGDDVSYAEAVDVMATIGVFNGTGDGSNFDPKGTLTREQAAKIITYMLIGQTQADKLVATIAPFADVSADRWSAGAIAYCASEGIMNGTGNGKFNPTGELTGLQFAKMLLVALGYDADIEDMTGPAWGLATSKLAYDINLDDGLAEDVNLTNVLTREQAAQMAFTTMKTPMVQYADKGTTIEVNGATVSFGAKQASYRTSTVDKGQTISTDRLTNGGGFLVEFAERHCTDLSLRKGTDDFGRPADKWYWKSEKIGTYEDEATLTYTKKVSMGDIYKDLGISSNIALDSLTYYENGVAPYAMTPYAVRRGDDDNKIGGNGVLTQVFYDDDTHTAIITLINTYTGEISRTVPASGNKDAYIVIAADGAAKPSSVGGTVNFETNAKIDDDTRVLYTYSEDAEEVIDVAVAESVSGIVTRAENKKTDGAESQALTIDGTRYAASAMIAGESIGEVTVKNDYTVYLDNYGYAIYVEETEVGIGNYALLINTATPSTFIGNRARLLLADGTIKNVTTDKDYNSAGSDQITPYTIVTFRVDEDDVYSLRKVDTAQSFMNADRAGTNGDLDATVTTGDYAAAFSMTNDKAGITVDANANSYASAADVASTVFNANSATTFVVADPGKDGNDNDFTAYTGIKNAPTLGNVTTADGTNGVAAYWFCKGAGSKMITIMFIFPGSAVTVEDGNSKLVFVAKNSVGNLINDKDGEYFEYNAIIGDEIQKEVKIDSEVTINGSPISIITEDGGSQSAATKRGLNGLFKSSSVDKYGVITGFKPYTAYSDGSTEQYLVGTGIDKRNKEYTLILNTAPGAGDHGSTETITAADDCKYYYVDKKGNISTSSYNSIAIDTNDKVYAVVKDYLVQVLVVEEVANPADTYQVNFTGTGVAKVDLTDHLGAPLVTPVTGIEKDGSLTFTVTAKEGVSNVKVTANGGTLSNSGDTYTLNNITKTITVTITADGSPVDKANITLNMIPNIRVSIDGTRYNSGGTIALGAGSHDVTVNWGSTPTVGKVVYVNDEKQVVFSNSGTTDEYTITVAEGDTVTVGLKTQKLTLVSTWHYEWAADSTKLIEAQGDAAYSSTAIDVPVGAAVKVTPADAACATTHYLYNPAANEAEQMHSGADGAAVVWTFEMPDKAVEITADKYYKVSMNADSIDNSAGVDLKGMVLTASITAYGANAVAVGTDHYVKNGDKITVTFELDTTNKTGNVGADIKALIGGTGTATVGSSDSKFKTATNIIATGTDTLAIDTDAVTVNGTNIGSAADVVLQYALS